MGDIAVAIADDHQLVRAGFASLLDAEPGINVRVQTSGGAAAWPFFFLIPIFWVLIIGLVVTLTVTLNRRRWRQAGGPPCLSASPKAISTRPSIGHASKC